jgi:hypothetical protein
LASENIDRIKETLDETEESLISRIPSVAIRSPDFLAEELSALNVILELKMKLSLR